MLRCSRRLFLLAAIVGAIGRSRTSAEEHALLAEVPTSGGRRPGPVAPVATRPAAAPRPALTPTLISIEKAAVDAPIEQVDIVDGVMQNPSGPWVVSWYHDLGGLGEGGNVVMSGHVDYWDVGPAVFWNLNQLVPGDAIQVYGEDDTVFSYAVSWMKNYVVAEMTEADFDEMLGDRGEEELTLITCAIGTFDPVTQEYRERMVLRATQVA